MPAHVFRERKWEEPFYQVLNNLFYFKGESFPQFKGFHFVLIS